MVWKLRWLLFGRTKQKQAHTTNDMISCLLSSSSSRAHKTQLLLEGGEKSKTLITCLYVHFELGLSIWNKCVALQGLIWSRSPLLQAVASQTCFHCCIQISSQRNSAELFPDKRSLVGKNYSSTPISGFRVKCSSFKSSCQGDTPSLVLLSLCCVLKLSVSFFAWKPKCHVRARQLFPSLQLFG